MRGVLGSHRWRRRLAWAAAALGVAATIAVVFVAIPQGGRPLPSTPLRNAPPQSEQSAKPLRLTPQIRAELTRTLVAFVDAGVARHNPAAAWSLATPALRAGSTLADWRRGQLPVFPYPAQTAQARSWTLLSATQNDVTVDLVFQPPRGSKRGPIEYQAYLTPVRRGGVRRWLIDGFIAVRVYPGTEAKPHAGPKPLPPNYTPSYPKGRLSPLWFAVPGVLLGLIVLVPAFLALRGWRRGVRAERAYRASLRP